MFTKFSDPLKFLGENSNSFKLTTATPSLPSSGPKLTQSSPSSKYGTDNINSFTNTKSKPSTPPSNSNTKTNSTTQNNNIGIKEFVNMGFNRGTFPIEEDKNMNDIFRKVIVEYMDYTDIETNRRLMALDEEEQNTVLVSLTKKFYEMIVGKVDQVDFGEIPASKGDITKLSRYKNIVKCTELMADIFQQYREDPEPVKVINTAIDNVIVHKDLFMTAFAVKNELGIYMYNSITLGIINALSYMIAVCIEYVKDPKNDGMKIVMDKTGIGKVKDHLVYENIIKFNESCRKGDIENALRPLVRSKAKGFVGTAILGIKVAVVFGGVLLAIVPLIRDLVYFFFAARARVSSYFDLQAELLEMNSNELKNNPDIKTEDDKKSVIRRQLKIAGVFRKLADSIAVDAKTSERTATNDIKKDSKTYKIDDVETQPDAGSGDPLF